MEYEALRERFRSSYPKGYLDHLDSTDPLVMERMFVAFCHGMAVQKEMNDVLTTSYIRSMSPVLGPVQPRISERVSRADPVQGMALAR